MSKSDFKEFDRRMLLTYIDQLKQEIKKLREKTLEDHIRDIIKDEINAHHD